MQLAVTNGIWDVDPCAQHRYRPPLAFKRGTMCRCVDSASETAHNHATRLRQGSRDCARRSYAVTRRLTSADFSDKWLFEEREIPNRKERIGDIIEVAQLWRESRRGRGEYFDPRRNHLR